MTLASNAPEIYVAGPDLFDRDRWPAHVERVTAAAMRHGLVAYFPVPPTPVTGPGISEPGSAEAAHAIYASCLDGLRTTKGVLANLTPFRGAEPDAGTVFEVATAIAWGRPVVGYVVSDCCNGGTAEPVSFAADGAWLDARGRVIERFGAPINTMPWCGMMGQLYVGPEDQVIDAALRALADLQSAPIMRPNNESSRGSPPLMP